MNQVLRNIDVNAITPALALLPPKMTSSEARVAILTIGLQETEYETRIQYNDGPARSFWQFEKGGGIKGILNHHATRELTRVVCAARGVVLSGDPAYAIWKRMETDDVLGAACARLLLYSDPYPLPKLGQVQELWTMYAKRTWNPGKPHPEKWPRYYAAALTYVKEAYQL